MSKSKIGLSFTIDVNKIDKSRIYQGEKGKYMKCTCFVDWDTPGQYGDHGFITQETTKEEREEGVRLPIIGNTKVFYIDETLKTSNTCLNKDAGRSSGQTKSDSDDDDIPF